MDFRHFAEADCGQPNAIAQLSSHLTNDRAFQDTHGQVFPNSSADQLVEQFLQETRALPQTFRMDGLMREMQEIESQRLALPPVPASAVKEQIQHDSAWAQQYIDDGKVFNENFDQDTVWAEIRSQEQDFLESQKFQGLNLETVDVEENVKDGRFAYTEFMNFMKNVDDGEIIDEEAAAAAAQRDSEIWSDEFLRGAAGGDFSDLLSEEMAAAEEEKNSKIWENIEKQVKEAVQVDEDLEPQWISDVLHEGVTEPYAFSEDNPMIDINDALEKGKEYLEQGDFPTAVLCFEAAVKKSPTNTEAWFYLGRTQAENEQDPNAIAALRECIKLDPTHLQALMALAVSLTNENYYNQACETLLTWLKNNPKYSDLVPVNYFKLSGQVSSLLSQKKSAAVQDIFMKAARRQPVDIDYEVQCALGVLFNLSGDYDKAVDCFRAALAVKPDDARLWNRLGATLANGSNPVEAVEAYHNALSISPGFIRARYNVGITCINLNSYKEAAEHFLTALNQQSRGQDVMKEGSISQMSQNIWSTLKMCVTLMSRPDLRPLVEARDLGALNKAFDIVDENVA